MNWIHTLYWLQLLLVPKHWFFHILHIHLLRSKLWKYQHHFTTEFMCNERKKNEFFLLPLLFEIVTGTLNICPSTLITPQFTAVLYVTYNTLLQYVFWMLSRAVIKNLIIMCVTKKKMFNYSSVGGFDHLVLGNDTQRHYLYFKCF